MSNTLPVVAAIPNFNMAEQLRGLVPQTLEQGYAAVYVLDDASTDHSRDVVEAFGKDVTFVAGETNKGSGGNRNRIIEALAERPATIHFLDADVRLLVEPYVEVAQDIMADPSIGIAGGLVLDRNGAPSVWNYGPRFGLYADLTAIAHAALGDFPRIDAKARPYLGPVLGEWPNIHTHPQRRDTFWVMEANMLVRSDELAVLGGFDEAIRYHDIQDVAIRNHAAGRRAVFDPSFAVIHTDAVNVRQADGNRSRQELAAELYIARKNGLRNWLLPDGHFKPRYNQQDD